MSIKIPPLNSLKAFEVCGRHLNIASASEELCVTPAAVSQQIKHLENWLGHPLFKRTNKGVEFTDCGKKYHKKITESFTLIAAATKVAAKPCIQESLIISSTASFTMKWLFPKIDEFRDSWPNIDIKLHTVGEINKFNPEESDVSILYGLDDFNGFYSREIIRDELVVVGSPKILNGGDKLPSQSLPDQLLLVDRHPSVISCYPSWHEFFNYFQIPVNNNLVYREFTEQWMVLQSAINNKGIALVKKSLVQEDINSGNLVVLLDENLQLETGYYFVCIDDMQYDPVVKSFENWLINHAVA